MNVERDKSSRAPVCRTEAEDTSSLRIWLTGELDAQSTPPIERRLAQELASGYRRVILNLAGVTFLDSFGIRLVVTVLKNKGPDGELTLVRPRAHNAQRALELVGLERVISFISPDCAD